MRCRGEWAAWGSRTMFASASGAFCLAFTLFISPAPSRSPSLPYPPPAHLPLSLDFCCSCFLFLTHSALHLSLSLVPFISLASLFSSPHSFSAHTLSLFFSPSLKSLAFLPLSLPPFKQQKAISLPLSGRLAVSP